MATPSPVIARTIAPRPKLHGRVVEVRRRRTALGGSNTFDRTVTIWSPVIGAHTHQLIAKGKDQAYAIAAKVGQAPVQVNRRR